MKVPYSIARSSPTALRRPIIFPAILRRPYATHSSLTGTSTTTRRKTVTPFNDDGRISWGDLSTGEKIARTTQQTFNFVLIVVGVVATGAVASYLYFDVFSTDSKTAHFNRAANKVRDDTRCTELLGKNVEFRNTLEAQHSRTFGAAGRRRSPTTVSKDRYGTEWMYMRFYAVGDKAIGEVQLQMTKRPDERQFQPHKLWMDVKGAKRVMLEDADAAKKDGRRVPGKMFGVRWW
ncbi:MAG: mitochondrial import inner membrane translocase subunit tim21 [Bathelium mastoideum]|nr:MAG: mitochondrial import inner membrane translocase subunit tim21 [Bathelium mastoideum]